MTTSHIPTRGILEDKTIVRINNLYLAGGTLEWTASDGRCGFGHTPAPPGLGNSIYSSAVPLIRQTLTSDSVQTSPT